MIYSKLKSWTKVYLQIAQELLLLDNKIILRCFGFSFNLFTSLIFMCFFYRSPLMPLGAIKRLPAARIPENGFAFAFNPQSSARASHLLAEKNFFELDLHVSHPFFFVFSFFPLNLCKLQVFILLPLS